MSVAGVDSDRIDPGVALIEREAPISVLPGGSYRWMRSDDREAAVGAPDRGYLREDQGDYQMFAKILFKHNGYRPGPVRGWYVVVPLDSGLYAVGQMRADAFAPLQIFEDLIFSSEQAARRRAEQLRGNRPGAMRQSGYFTDSMRAEPP